MKHVLLAIMLMALLVTPAFAGWQTRTLEIQAIRPVTVTFEVPYVLDNPENPVDEELCTYKLVSHIETSYVTKKNAKIKNVDVAEGTDITTKFRDSRGTEWTYDYTAGNGDKRYYKSGCFAGYIAKGMYNEVDETVYEGEIDDLRCPPESVSTHTVTNTVTFDEVVTHIYLGQSITVKGHIWTKSVRPVEYWYVAQKATIPENAVTVAKSDRIVVPDVDGVYPTKPFMFTPEKPGLYRIFLRVLKQDGQIGEIRTKVVVTAPQTDEVR